LICFRKELTVTEPSGNAIFAAVSSRINKCFSMVSVVIVQCTRAGFYELGHEPTNAVGQCLNERHAKTCLPNCVLVGSIAFLSAVNAAIFVLGTPLSANLHLFGALKLISVK
jgi:hypothetical protein